MNFENIGSDRVVELLSHTYKNRLYKVDEFSVDGGSILYLAGDAVGEKAYYLLTAVVKEQEGLTQVFLRANSDKDHGLTGFLNETLDNLRHLVVAGKVREIGVIRKEQVINIIDSIVQRSSFGGGRGEGGASVNIRDSVVQRTEFNADEGRRVEREEQRRLENERKEKEKLEKLRMQKEQEEKEQLERVKQKAQDEAERKKREEEERLERERKAQEERERTEADVARKVKEQHKAQEKEDLILKQRVEPQKPKPKSRKNVFMFAIVLVALLVGFTMFPLDSGDVAEVSSTSIQPSASSNQKTITNSIGMELVLIPAGEFDMGSPSHEEGRYDNEGHVHKVRISDSFYLGKYEVTQKQWRDVMGNDPSYFKGDDLPVEQVSWNDVQEFIKKLNEKESTNKYRLPSEAEWEYAARAGTTTRYSFGDSELMFGEYAWYYDNSGSQTHPVGQKKPNSWGLYDMHGNVFEWVQDDWHGDYEGAPSDGSAWESGGSDQVLRGGSWGNDARYRRSAFRFNLDPGYRNRNLGFRLLRPL